MFENTQKLYNTPIEVGIRLLVILDKSASREVDTEWLMYVDYLSLNTNDIGGPSSIHAPIPNRNVQLYSKKNLIQQSLMLLLTKELVNHVISEKGFFYSINLVGKKFLEYFDSDYFFDFSERADWVCQKFKNHSNQQIRDFINSHLSNWGGELTM